MNLRLPFDVLRAFLALFFVVASNCEIFANQVNQKKSVNESHDQDNKKKADQENKKDNNKNNNKKKEDKERKKESTKSNSAPVLKKKLPLVCPLGNSEIRTWIKIRLPEFFYGKNLSLLNNDNSTDRVIYFRHTLDLNAEYKYGIAPDPEILFAKVNLRNKGVWGDPESIAATNSSTIKIEDSVIASHEHGIPRHIIWIRELWIQFSLNDFLSVPFYNKHTLAIGSFPFELGRGIALGASYKVDASDLGYYSEAAVDQYAFGAKLSGVLTKDCLLYDLYAAILDNKSSSFSDTNAKIRGQQFGHRNSQARGFGIINYVVAGKLRWFHLKKPNVNLYFEPYVLYNHNPEQKIEFLGDSQSDLITLGLASEGSVGDFEWGFDTAFNLGSQKVHGWDRNAITIESRTGALVEVNTKVKQITEQDLIDQNLSKNDPELCKKVKNLALKLPQNQAIINVSEQSGDQNGKIIGENEFGILINDCERFVDPYINSFSGSMFVFDFGYYIKKPDLKVAAAFGFATGDKDPNRDLERIGDSQVDGDYEGFISLQETYSGTRVKSAFLLSGSGKVPRLLSFPSQDVGNPFAISVSRFTNIIFTGASAYYKPYWSEHKWSINPNFLAYWQEDPSRFFDREIQKSRPNQVTSTFLGVELNLFAEGEVIDGLRLFIVGSIFFPGSHYKDVKGYPLNKAQQKFLDNLDNTGIVNDHVPLLGTDPTYFANIGLEYKF